VGSNFMFTAIFTCNQRKKIISFQVYNIRYIIDWKVHQWFKSKLAGFFIESVKLAYFWLCVNSSAPGSSACPFLEQRRRSIIAGCIEGKLSVRTAVFFLLSTKTASEVKFYPNQFLGQIS
jgi:hypothetical protein